MYLDEGVPTTLLKRLREISESHQTSTCFADRFEEIRPAIDRESGRNYLAKVGWTLMDWMTRAGATRHLGIARI